MYRRYEDPYEVNKLLCEAREELERAEFEGADDETLRSLAEDVASLEERLNFAWQDDEEAEDEEYEDRYTYADLGNNWW